MKISFKNLFTYILYALKTHATCTHATIKKNQRRQFLKSTSKIKLKLYFHTNLILRIYKIAKCDM